MTLTSTQIRQQFIDFFVQKHSHTPVPSSPVVPYDDPTLLFTNAGMNQFKDVFLGIDSGGGKREYSRAVDTQKCIRAGGKHNDLDDVGKDTYHHTFFEMLGNWSFGDYFKKEAIQWAWQLLVEQWKLDPDRLHASYFEGDESEGLEPDLEARDLWLKYLPESHVHACNKKDNFWEMGDTGPCGPCSEIHYDNSPNKDSGHLVNADDQDTVIEIWNLVFIQYNRNQDGSLSPLPAKHVDTGMGFERIVRVIQGKDSNYDTDVFTPIFKQIQSITGARAYTPGGHKEALEDPINIAYRVIADHIRTLVFALSDGAHCGNEGRNYVLRRILRRAVKYGRIDLHLHGNEYFLYKLVKLVAGLFEDVFPEASQKIDEIQAAIFEEEKQFANTWDRGIATLLKFVQGQVHSDEINASVDTLGHYHGEIYQELFDINGGEFGKQNPELHDTVKHLWLSPTNGYWFREMYTDYSPVNQLKECCGGFQKMQEYKEQFLQFQTVLRDEKTWERDGVPSLITKSKIHTLLAKGDDLIRHFSSLVDSIHVSGKIAFTLHDTYGFPIDLTQLMAEERGLDVDIEGFEREMEKARELSRGGSSGATDNKALLTEWVQQNNPQTTEFVGEGDTQLDARVSHVIELPACAAVVLDRTAFYAEQGGQVGDCGAIVAAGKVFNVTDTQKIGDIYFHIGTFESDAFSAGDSVNIAVEPSRRSLITSNHTTTHVMNRALRDRVSEDANQKGSLVDDEKTRFDFSHNAPLTVEELEAVEKQVNDDIAADLPVYTGVAPQEKAIKINGLRAVFGEKYPPEVRIVSIGAPVDELLSDPDSERWATLSIEFCGGTHLQKTGDAEGFVIVSEEGVAKGVRRITAITGAAAHKAQALGDQLLARLEAVQGNEEADTLNATVSDITATMEAKTLPAIAKHQLRDGLKRVQDTLKKLDKAQQKQSAGAAVEVARKLAEELTGPIIVADLGVCDAAAIQSPMDVMRKKHPKAAVLLIGAAGDKVALMATVPKPLIEQGLKAGDWIKHVAPIVGGGGGGRPDSARAGGKDATKIGEAVEAATSFASEKMN